MGKKQSSLGSEASGTKSKHMEGEDPNIWGHLERLETRRAMWDRMRKLGQGSDQDGAPVRKRV